MRHPRLTYFSSRGRAELIRLVLAEAAVAYEEIAVGEYDANALPPAFRALRSDGALAFDGLPLWEEADDFRLVQSDAILRYVARTHDRYGVGARDAARVDLVLAGIEDTRVELRRLFSVAPAARAALREDLLATILPRWLGRFERLIGDADFVLGARITIADVALWYLLETVRDNGFAAATAACPRLDALVARIGLRPGLAAWLTDPRRWPAQLLPT